MVLDWILRSWLTRTAQQKMYEAASQTLHEAAASALEAENEPEPRIRPCDVAVLCALEIEQGGLEDRLSGVVRTQGAGFVVRQGGLQGRHVLLVETGVGAKAAAAAAEAVIAGHHPAWVLSIGFAGGLQPHLSRNDLLVANRLVRADGQNLTIDVRFPPESLAQTKGLHVGSLLTMDRLVRLSPEKEELGRAHQALAVDMETFAVAEVCRRQKTRFLSVRVVTDTMHDQLPADLDRLLRKKHQAGRWGAALGAVVARPGSLKDLLDLKERALRASDRLAQFVRSMILQLVPLAPRSDHAADQGHGPQGNATSTRHSEASADDHSASGNSSDSAGP